MQVKFDVSTVLDDRVIPLQNLKVGIKLIGIMFLFYLQLPHIHVHVYNIIIYIYIYIYIYI